MTPRTIPALALAAVVAAAALPGVAAGQTKADAFAGKIPPVSGQLFRKAGRLELTVLGDLSLNDAFFTKYFGGAKLAWHFTESLSAGVYASTGMTRSTGSAVVCTAAAGCSDASETQLRQVPGRIQAIAGVEAAWTPVYGKLGVLAERIAHFDLGVVAGPDAIRHEQVLSKRDAQGGVAPATETAIGGHVGLAARLFVSEWLALRLEVKDYVYLVEVPNNGSGKDLQNQLFTELGLSVFLPTRNRTTR
jgi:outer membrane beta-barrel protein